MQAAAIQPEKLLKQLAALWTDLGKQETQGVLRACSMTLIAVTDGPENDTDFGQTLALLMHEHPSRLIVIRIAETAAREIGARVLAQCWMPFGRNQQICCEQIELAASAETLGDVPPVIRGLTVPDLPVVIYCPSVRLLGTAGFEELAPLAGRLIVDSRHADDCHDVLRYLAVRGRSRPRAADLTWSRLTPWRETISRMFDEPLCRRAIYSLDEIQILYAGAREPSGAYYLAGWFMHVLGTAPRLRIARGVGPSYASIANVTMSGPGFNASAELMDAAAVEATVNGVQRRIVFPDASDAAALRQELGIGSRDVLFEHVLGLANLLRGTQ